ncbi:MAG: DNA repair protein RecO [Bacteroidetes bacterium]|nr:MAG: DNA repair protein RecO [Bacteroidota bacterium]
MQTKTEAIVLKAFKYSETSIIAKIYTKEFGLLSFMVHGVRKKKSKFSASFFQPLQILNLEIKYKTKSNLHAIQDLSLSEGIQSIYSNIIKSSIAFFLAEVISKTVREEETNDKLFYFLQNSIVFLEEADEGSISNFHIIFLISLSKHLGFYPKYSDNKYFNIYTGGFENTYNSQYCFDEKESQYFGQLMKLNYSNSQELRLSKEERKEILSGILRFYHIHLPEMGEIKSLEVLEVIFQ